ncbi:sigma-70 family RNA polymerase sigma factor [Actinopolymorpha pittospori]
MPGNGRTTLADRSGVAELHSLLRALFDAHAHPVPATVSGAEAGPAPAPRNAEWLLQASHQEAAKTRTHGAHIAFDRSGTREPAEDTGTTRIVALVELAKRGDAEAFGQLYDHYLSTVYRYVYYRVGTHALAEDLASETFLRALRALSSFHWQGRDFGAWLVTIARNLVTDHFKSGRFRLEVATGEILDFDVDSTSDGPEDDVLSHLTNEALVKALRQLRADQQECLVLRFFNGLSVAETAHVLGKSDGAVKQLQLRAVRNLAKLLPEGVR